MPVLLLWHNERFGPGRSGDGGAAMLLLAVAGRRQSSAASAARRAQPDATVAWHGWKLEPATSPYHLNSARAAPLPRRRRRRCINGSRAPPSNSESSASAAVAVAASSSPSLLPCRPSALSRWSPTVAAAAVVT